MLFRSVTVGYLQPIPALKIPLWQVFVSNIIFYLIFLFLIFFIYSVQIGGGSWGGDYGSSYGGGPVREGGYSQRSQGPYGGKFK